MHKRYLYPAKPAPHANILIMNIVVLTADKTLPGEADLLNALFRAGLQRLHIRKPALTVDETRNFINGIDRIHHKKLVIHRHHNLHQEMTLGGIHLSSFDLADASLMNKIAGTSPDAVSASLHSWSELEALPFTCSYVFISPVFNSISKPGYNAAIDLGVLQKMDLNKTRKILPMIYGLGGVNKDNITTLKQNGFDGAALLGAIWQSKDPVAAFVDIRSAAEQSH